MTKPVRISNRTVGPGHRVLIIADVGVNHNGDLRTALRLIDAAGRAGCDGVKFQKRAPADLQNSSSIRDTPWGQMRERDYRARMEFDEAAYVELAGASQAANLMWFASVWDVASVEFMLRFDVPCLKVPSARLADESLLRRVRDAGLPVLLSTGMSRWSDVDAAVRLLSSTDLVILQCTSSYPTPSSAIDLRAMQSMAKRYSRPIGYSGHESGIAPSIAAVAMGATYLERHITLDRETWGSDHRASLEPQEFRELVTGVRDVEAALGSVEKRVHECERVHVARLIPGQGCAPLPLAVAYCGTCRRDLSTVASRHIGKAVRCPGASEKGLPHRAGVVAASSGRGWIYLEALLLSYEYRWSPMRWTWRKRPIWRGRAGLYIAARTGLLIITSLIAVTSSTVARGLALTIGLVCYFDVMAANTSIAFVSRRQRDVLRSSVFTMVAFLDLVLFFGAMYTLLGGRFAPEAVSMWEAIYFSAVTMTTLGLGDIQPQNDAALVQMLVVWEVFSAVYFLTLLAATVVGRWVGGLNSAAEIVPLVTLVEDRDLAPRVADQQGHDR